MLSLRTRAEPRDRGVRLHGALRRRDRALVRRARGGLPGAVHALVREGARPAVRREPAPARGLLRGDGRAHAPAVDGVEAPRQGAVLQQPARPRRGAPAARGVRAAGGGDHQAQQPVRRRGGGDGRRRVRQGARDRPAERLRRRLLLQPAGRPRAGRAARRDVRRAGVRAGLRRGRARDPAARSRTCGCSRTRSGAPCRSASTTSSACAAGCSCRTATPGSSCARTCRSSTARKPTEEEWGELLFAMRVCKHVRSNAIVLARGLATVGIGAGQMSRVDSVRIAVDKARAAELAARRSRHGVRRVLPVRRRTAAGDRRGRASDHPARRIAARPGGRRRHATPPAWRWCSPPAAISAIDHPPVRRSSNCPLEFGKR